MDPQTAQWDAQWKQLHPNEGMRPEGYHGEGSGVSSAPGSYTGNYIDVAKQMMDLQKQANQPAIQQLQSQIPTTQQAFAQRGQQLQAEVDPLKQRYQSLLDSITKQQGVDIQRTSTGVAREFGARGIPLSSGAYGQYLNQQLLPVNAAYSGQIAEAGFNREDALRQIQNMIAQNPIQQTQAEQQINQAIAQLQAGGSSQAIQNALGLYQQQQQANQFSQEQALRQQTLQSQLAQSTAEQAFKEKQYQEVTLPTSKYELGKPYYKPETASSGAAEWLMTQFGMGAPMSTPKGNVWIPAE